MGSLIHFSLFRLTQEARGCVPSFSFSLFRFFITSFFLLSAGPHEIWFPPHLSPGSPNPSCRRIRRRGASQSPVPILFPATLWGKKAGEYFFACLPVSPAHRVPPAGTKRTFGKKQYRS